MLKQKAISIWFIGLSGAGKTTIACEVRRELQSMGFFTVLLDADEIRKGLTSGLGFSTKERKENIRRVAEVSKLFVENGVITLNAFICPIHELQDMAKNIIGDDKFILIYLNSSLEICEKRDTKGLYSKARKGEIKDFTGINAPFEVPEYPNLIVDTGKESIEKCKKQIIDYLLDKINIE